jgi:hypothetical protein
MANRRPTQSHDQAAIRAASKFSYRTLDLLGIARVDRAYLHPEGRCHALDGGQLTDPGKFDGIPNDGGSR